MRWRLRAIPSLQGWTVDVGPITRELCGGIDPATPLEDLAVVSLDLETTGLLAWRGDRVCEVGLVRATVRGVDDLLSVRVDPGMPIPAIVRQLTGISDADVSGEPSFESIVPRVYEMIGDLPLVVHNAPFDLAFFKQSAPAVGLPMLPNLTVDTLLAARMLSGGRQKNSLTQVCERLGIERGQAHRAIDDARAAALVFFRLLDGLAVRDVRTVGALVRSRVAATAERLVEQPSSVLLDMLSVAVARQAVLDLAVSRPPGSTLRRYRVRALKLDDDRLLTARVLKSPDASPRRLRDRLGLRKRSRGERQFVVAHVMTVDDGDRVFVSPWMRREDAPVPGEMGKG